MNPFCPSRPPAVRIMRHFNLEPDPWQLGVLESDHPRQLLNCCRQAGKSTVVAIRALAEAVFTNGTLVLLVSRSHRQSRILFEKVIDFYHRLGAPLRQRVNADELVLSNHSRVVSLPCQEETIRGYSGVSRLIIDAEFLAEERRELGEAWFRQEYCCSFEATEGLVYPDFARCVVSGPAPAGGRLIGGIDFGYSNPFAAVWGVLTRDSVLCLTGEHYARQKSLAYHVARLPPGVMWYCDPAGAQERVELIAAGLKVQKGLNPIRPGIMAVSARLESGRLKVLEGACPKLLYEASLYRYPEGGGSEVPEDDHNHAVGALRYLVSRLDERRMARAGRGVAPADAGEAPLLPPKPVFRPYRDLRDDPDVWTSLS